MDIVILGLVILDIVLFISLSRGGMGGIARQYGEYCVAASPLSRGEFVGVDVLDDPLTPLSRGEFVGVDVLNDPLPPIVWRTAKNQKIFSKTY